MLQQSFHPILAEENYRQPTERIADGEVMAVGAESHSVLTALDRLEETILNSPRLPMTGKTMINEDEILERLDAIRLNLPESIAMAQEVLQYKDRMIKEAQQQVQQIVAEANQRAYQVANELGIIERTEQEAQQLRQAAIAECEQLRQQTITEVERVRHHHLQDLELLRHQATTDCQQIQDGADEYAERVLSDMEKQLVDVLQVIKRGRQRLNTEAAAARKPTEPQKRSRDR